MLVREIETQRQPQGTARPPILPIPAALPIPKADAATASPSVSQNKPAVSPKEAQ
jgi:hypothetical protein